MRALHLLRVLVVGLPNFFVRLIRAGCWRIVRFEQECRVAAYDSSASSNYAVRRIFHFMSMPAQGGKVSWYVHRQPKRMQIALIMISMETFHAM